MNLFLSHVRSYNSRFIPLMIETILQGNTKVVLVNSNKLRSYLEHYDNTQICDQNRCIKFYNIHNGIQSRILNMYFSDIMTYFFHLYGPSRRVRILGSYNYLVPFWSGTRRTSLEQRYFFFLTFFNQPLPPCRHQSR